MIGFKILRIIEYSCLSGGDWGYLVTRAQSYLYPESVKGVHVNVSIFKYSSFILRSSQWAFAAEPEWTAENPKPEKYSERETKQLEMGAKWFPFGTGEGRGYVSLSKA